MRLHYLDQARIGCEQSAIQSQFHKAAIGAGTIYGSLQGPVFVDLIVGSFFAKVGLTEQIGGPPCALVAQELPIHIELADIAEIQRGQILTWSESYEPVAEKILVTFKIGTIDVVGACQLVTLESKIGQQPLFDLFVVALQPIVGVESVTGLHYACRAPETVFVTHDLAPGIHTEPGPLFNIGLIQHKSRRVHGAVPVRGHSGLQ